MGSRCLKSAQPDMSLSKNPSIHYLPLIQFRVDGGDHSSLKHFMDKRKCLFLRKPSMSVS